MIFFPPSPKKNHKIFFSKYHNFVKNSRTAHKIYTQCTLGIKEEICRWKSKNNEHLLIFDDFGKNKLIMGKKLGFVRKKLVTSSTSKCSKNCAFHYFSKNKNFERSFLAKKTPPKRILRKNETHSFSDHFCKPPQKRLESAVLEGHCKFSIKSIICSN